MAISINPVHTAEGEVVCSEVIGAGAEGVAEGIARRKPVTCHLCTERKALRKALPKRDAIALQFDDPC